MSKTTEKPATSKTVKTLSPKEAAAKHIAAKAAQKQAEIDAKAAMLADAVAGNENPAEVKPEVSKIQRNKPGKAAENKPATNDKPATENKPEVKKPVKTAAELEKEKAERKALARVEFAKTAAILAIKAGYATKDSLTYRNKREEVKAGDICIFHNKAGFSQLFTVEHISKAGTLSLELYRDDDKNNRAGSAGSWTAETWDINYLCDIHTRRKDSYMKKREFAFFGKK